MRVIKPAEMQFKSFLIFRVVWTLHAGRQELMTGEGVFSDVTMIKKST